MEELTILAHSIAPQMNSKKWRWCCRKVGLEEEWRAGRTKLRPSTQARLFAALIGTLQISVSLRPPRGQ